MNRQLLFILVGLAIFLGGCSLAPKYTRPEAPVPDQWPKGTAYTETQSATEEPAISVPELKWEDFFADKQLQKIIKTQGGNPQIDSEEVQLGNIIYPLRASKTGRVRMIENQDLASVAKNLGAPFDKKAGVYLEKLPGELVKEGDTLCSLYATSQARLNLGLEALEDYPIYLLD